MAETYATLKTNHGDIVVHLFPNPRPKTVENFVGLAEGTQYVDPSRASAPPAASTTVSASTGSSPTS